jgi:putative transposase
VLLFLPISLLKIVQFVEREIQKTLSTRTHQCPNCQTVLDGIHNAAINILKKGLTIFGNYLNASTSLGIDTELSRSVNGTVGQTETDPNA